MGDEKRTQKICGLLPYRSLREVRDEDTPLIHREREIEARGDLSEDEPQVRRRGELPGLVQDRRDGVSAKLLRVAWELFLPETQRLRVAHARHDALAEGVVRVEAGEIDEGRVLAGDQRGNAVIEEMFEARSPAITPEMLERGDDAGGGKRAPRWRDSGSRIEADRILRLPGVEVAHLIDTRMRDGVENVLGQVAVWVDDGDALSRDDVGHRKIEEKRRSCPSPICR